MKKVYICIPTYNEATNILSLLTLIQNQTRSIKDYTIGVIVIDDNSPDGTGNIVEDFKSQCQMPLEIIHNPGKAGLARAYIQGFQKAIELGAYAVCEMDADFSHDPKYLPAIFNELNNYDLVMGSRYTKGGSTEGWPLKRQLISFGGNLYAKLILGVGVNDLTGGFNCYKTEIFKVVDLNQVTSNGYSFQIELKYKTIKKGFSYKEVPINFKDRVNGQSKFNGGIFKEAIWKPWKLRFGM